MNKVSSGRGVNAILAMGPMAEEGSSGPDDSASAPSPTTQPCRRTSGACLNREHKLCAGRTCPCACHRPTGKRHVDSVDLRRATSAAGEILHRHGICIADIATAAGVSATLASFILDGLRADRRGVIEAALTLLPEHAHRLFLDVTPIRLPAAPTNERNPASP